MGNGIIKKYANYILNKDTYQYYNDQDFSYAGKLYLNSLGCTTTYSNSLCLWEENNRYYIAWTLNDIIDLDISDSSAIKFKNKSGSVIKEFSKEEAHTLYGNHYDEETVNVFVGEFSSGVELSQYQTITCTKPEYSMFQTLTSNNIKLHYKKLDGKTVIDQGYINNVVVRTDKDTIRFSAKSGLSIFMSGHFLLDAICLITPSSSFLPADDIALAKDIDAYSLYLFNAQTLEQIYGESQSFLTDSLEVVKGAAKDSNEKDFDSTSILRAYDDIKKDYSSSVTGNMISKEILNKIGVNKITIPRYKVYENDNEYHFEGLSFPANRMQMTNDDKKTGQFCHDGDLILSIDKQLDAKYWSTIPHIYPEFVWDEWSGVNSRTSNEIDIKIRSDMLQVNGVQWELKKDDRVVVYRRSGTLTKQQYLPDIYWNSHAFTIDGHEIKDTIGENTWEGYQIDFNVDSYVVRDNIVLGRKDTYGNYEENNVFTTPLKNDFINVWKTETKNIEISLDHNTQNSDRQFLRGKTTLKFQLNDFPYFFYKDPITNMQLTTSENYEEFKHWYSGDERISGTIIYKLTTLEGILDKQYNLFNINTDSTTKVIKYAGNSYSMEYHKTSGQYYSKLYYDPDIGSGYTFELDVAWKLQPTNFKTYGYLIAIWRNGQLVL